MARWTEEEEKFLRENSSRGLNFLVRNLPNRSVDSIKKKCSNLKIIIGDGTIVERLYMVV